MTQQIALTLSGWELDLSGSPMYKSNENNIMNEKNCFILQTSTFPFKNNVTFFQLSLQSQKSRKIWLKIIGTVRMLFYINLQTVGYPF